jgi:hypothetical protein
VRQAIAPLCFLLLALVIVGCEEAQPDACTGSGALFADDFSGEENCGWALYEQNGASAELANGDLLISTSQPGQIWWTNPGKDFADTVIIVDTQVLTGPDDNALGVICRYQDSENYYVFLISGDGYYAIGRYQSGSDQVTYLTGGGEYTPSELINQGTAVNQLQVSCVGNELALAVNGVELERVTDTAFASGDVGLAAGTFQPGTLQVRFSDMQVIAP